MLDALCFTLVGLVVGFGLIVVTLITKGRGSGGQGVTQKSVTPQWGQQPEVTVFWQLRLPKSCMDVSCFNIFFGILQIV